MHRAILRLLVSLTVVALGLLSVQAVAVASDPGSNCGQANQVRLWENIASDNSDGDDFYWKCGGDSDLNIGDEHHQPGDCNRPLGGNSNWNDCVSSVTVWVSNGKKLCAFINQGYNGLKESFFGLQAGVRHDASGDWNDGLSSFRWRDVGQQCAAS